MIARQLVDLALQCLARQILKRRALRGKAPLHGPIAAAKLREDRQVHVHVVKHRFRSFVTELVAILEVVPRPFEAPPLRPHIERPVVHADVGPLHGIDGKHEDLGLGEGEPEAVGADHGLHTTTTHADDDDLLRRATASGAPLNPRHRMLDDFRPASTGQYACAGKLPHAITEQRGIAALRELGGPVVVDELRILGFLAAAGKKNREVHEIRSLGIVPTIRRRT